MKVREAIAVLRGFDPELELGDEDAEYLVTGFYTSRYEDDEGTDVTYVVAVLDEWE